MASVTLQVKLTTEDLISAIDKLEPAQAEAAIRQLLHLQALRRVPQFPERERELLSQILGEKRSGFQERFDTLSEKSRSFSISPDEQLEFLKLVDESECFAVRRLEALTELAHLRNISVPTLMQQLELKAPSVG